jgi:hypothetical protein
MVKWFHRPGDKNCIMKKGELWTRWMEANSRSKHSHNCLAPEDYAVTMDTPPIQATGKAPANHRKIRIMKKGELWTGWMEANSRSKHSHNCLAPEDYAVTMDNTPIQATGKAPANHRKIPPRPPR